MTAEAGKNLETETVEYLSTITPRMDVLENGNEIVLLADMPGVDDKSAEVSVDNNLLTIKGRVSNGKIQGYDLIREERGVDVFQRAFELSGQVDPAGIKAGMKAGVLRLVIPKREEAKPRTIAINAES